MFEQKNHLRVSYYKFVLSLLYRVGTSSPELAVSLNEAKRGKSEIAIGNVLGSNIFNAFGVMGISGLFGVLAIPVEMLAFSLPIMIVAALLYYFIT